jgi:hypothetical protein
MGGVASTISASVEIDVPDEPFVERDVVLSEAAISGTVTDEEGNAVAGAKVIAVREDTVHEALIPGQGSTGAGADGSYTIAGLEPGTYSIVVEAPGFAPVRRGPVTVAAAQTHGGVDVVLERGRVVRGRVVDPLGRPVARAMVLAWPEGGGVPRSSAPRMTDAAGSFAIIVPDASGLDITVIAAGWAPRRVSSRSAGIGEDAEMVIRLSPGGRIRVALRGPDGRPRTGIAVVAEPVGASTVTAPFGMLTAPPTTDENGAALLGSLAPGSYRVTLAWHEDFRAVPVDVREGEETAVELVVPD